GLDAFEKVLEGGGTEEQVAAAVAASGEYFRLHGSDNLSFLAALYQDVLERPIDDRGQAVFGGLLASTGNRSSETLALLSSQEYCEKLVNFPGSLATGGIVNSLPFGYYQLFLNRNAGTAAGQNEATLFVNLLLNNTPDEAVITRIVSSQEYFN